MDERLARRGAWLIGLGQRELALRFERCDSPPLLFDATGSYAQAVVAISLGAAPKRPDNQRRPRRARTVQEINRPSAAKDIA